MLISLCQKKILLRNPCRWESDIFLIEISHDSITFRKPLQQMQVDVSKKPQSVKVDVNVNSDKRPVSNFYFNHCLSPLTLWVRISLRRGVLDTTLCDKVYQWLAADRVFSLGTQVSSTNKYWPPNCWKYR